MISVENIFHKNVFVISIADDKNNDWMMIIIFFSSVKIETVVIIE